MTHTDHIIKNKQALELRSHIIRLIRKFFWSQKFLEVETPLILKLPGQEPYLSPMQINIHNETGKEYPGYLHTSPEYAMKKMLASGFENIFSICKCFRDYESFGGLHNPEFTMIEWYRANADMFVLMDDCEKLFENLVLKIKDLNPSYKLQVTSYNKFKRTTMKALWQKEVGVNLDDHLTTESMLKLCEQKNYQPKDDESYEDLFFRIFLNEIEPKLKNMGAVFIYHYPAQMAALARLSNEDPRYAERFELYINGVELANAFSELTDAEEQAKRLEIERELRRKLNKPTYDIDEEFIKAVASMPPSAGIALGVDRLIMAILGCQNINDVLVLPANELF